MMDYYTLYLLGCEVDPRVVKRCRDYVSPAGYIYGSGCDLFIFGTFNTAHGYGLMGGYSDHSGQVYGDGDDYP